MNFHPIRSRKAWSFSIGAPDTAINVTSRAFRWGIRLSNVSAIELFTGHSSLTVLAGGHSASWRRPSASGPRLLACEIDQS